MEAKKVEFFFEYWEEVMPPRCKVARGRANVGKIELADAAPTEEEAPVALRVRADEKKPVEYRLFNSELYVATEEPFSETLLMRRGLPASPCADNPFDGFIPKPINKELERFHGYRYGLYDYSAMVEMADTWAGGHIVFGGRFWEKTKEPCYCMDWVGVGLAGCPTTGNTANALEREVAVGEWTRRYGAEHVCAHAPTIEVVIPEAVALPPRAILEAYRDLDRARSSISGSGLTAASWQFDEDLADMVPEYRAACEQATRSLEEIEARMDKLLDRMAGRFGRGRELDEKQIEEVKKRLR